ncbi:hypothetical protein EGP91_00540 [bacterium]|nr:hypothetical protein [bacterium]
MKDAYNHISHEKIVIDKIDDISPKITSITNSSNGNWTNQNVTITLLATDDEMGITKYQIKYSGTNNNWQDLENNTSSFTNDLNETIYYRVIDKADNISEEVSTDVKIDKTVPITPSITNSKENTWTGSNLTVTVTSSDSGSGIDHFEWYENGAWTTRDLTTSGNTGTITYTVSRNETIRFRAVDKLGQASSEKTTVVKIDKTAPTQSFSIASSTSGSNGWYKALSIKVSVSDAHSGISSSKYCITTGSSCTPATNATLSSNTFNVSLGTNAIAQKICVSTTDVAGNTSDVSCSSAYKVDKNAPTLTISSSVFQNNITVSLATSDAGSGVGTYYYSRDGGKNFTSSTSNSYTFTGLSSGTYSLVSKVLDKAGNMSSTSSASQSIAGDINIYNSGTYAYSMLEDIPSYCGNASNNYHKYSSYFHLGPCGNKTLVEKQAISNKYRYLKVLAKNKKNNTYGSYNISRVFVSSSASTSNGMPNNVLANYFIANGQSSPDVTSWQTFKLDLSSVKNSSYYVGVHNCDSNFFVQRIWLSNNA